MREERSSFPIRNDGAPDLWPPDLLPLLEDCSNLPIAAALKVELHLLGEWLADPVSLFLTLPLPLPLPHRSIPGGASSAEAAIVELRSAQNSFKNGYLTALKVCLSLPSS